MQRPSSSPPPSSQSQSFSEESRSQPPQTSPRAETTTSVEVEECSVCINSIANADSFKLRTCQHVFHRVCLRAWVWEKKHHNCPNCRQDVRYDDYVSLQTLSAAEWRQHTALERISDCYVCCKPLSRSSKDTYKPNGCCHEFHKDCIKKWFDYCEKGYCPTCRAEVDYTDYVHFQTPQSQNEWAQNAWAVAFQHSLPHGNFENFESNRFESLHQFLTGIMRKTFGNFENFELSRAERPLLHRSMRDVFWFTFGNFEDERIHPEQRVILRDLVENIC